MAVGSVVVGFALGRFWAVLLVVGGWLLYIRVIYPANHPTTVRLEPGLQRWVEFWVDALTWVTAGGLGAACMIGVVIRWAVRESRRRRELLNVRA
ncbi:MAG TPA: hypothetical protein VF891_05895 [Gaiellaceae bacterium]